MSDREIEFDPEDTPVKGVELDAGYNARDDRTPGDDDRWFSAAPNSWNADGGPVASWLLLPVHLILPLALAIGISFLVNHQLQLVLREAVRSVRLSPWTPDLMMAAAVGGWDVRLWAFWCGLMVALTLLVAAAAQGVRWFDRFGIIPIGLATVILGVTAIGVVDLPGMLIPLFPAPEHAVEQEFLQGSLPQGPVWWAITAAVTFGLFAAWRSANWAAWIAVIAAGAAATLIADARTEEWQAFLHETVRMASGQDMLRGTAAQVYTESAGRAGPLLWVRSISDLLVFLTPWWVFRMSLR